MPGFNNDLKFDPLTPKGDLYDVITQNGPVPETFTYQKKIAHGPINENQSSNSRGGGNRVYWFIVSTRTIFSSQKISIDILILPISY